MGQRIEESTQDKGHRQLIELLQELRVALPGVQVLFAFLLTVPFTQGWAQVTSFQTDLYYASLLCSAAATAFLIAPSAIHRLDFEQGDKPVIVQISNVLAIIGLLIPRARDRRRRLPDHGLHLRRLGGGGVHGRHGRRVHRALVRDSDRPSTEEGDDAA